jgi:hypothetical protein
MRTARLWMLALFLFSIIGTADQALLAQKDQQLPRQLDTRHLPPNAETVRLVGGFWRIDHTFESELQISNRLITDSLTIFPTLVFDDGKSYALPAIPLKAAGTATVDINEAFRSVPPAIRSQHRTFGSITLAYNWHWSGAISAEVQNIDSDRSLSYVSSLLPESQTTESFQIMHGLWWKRHATTGAFVRLTNVAKNPIVVHLEVTNANGESIAAEAVTVGPMQTALRDVPAVASAETIATGGLDISYTGPIGGLIADGGLEDANHGFSARLPLYPPPTSHKAQKLITLASTGIMIGQPSPGDLFPPQVFFRPWLKLRNVSSSAKVITVEANYQMGVHPVRVPLVQLTLAPTKSASVPVDEEVQALQLLPQVMDINFAVSFEGLPSDVIVSSGSVDDAGSYVFEVPPDLVGRSASKDICLWKSGNGLDTMISIWNHNSSAQSLVLKLQFEGGSYKVPILLDSDSSRTLNLFQILHPGKPDSDGHIIPDGIEVGNAVLEGNDGEAADIEVTTTASVYDVGHATCVVKCVNCSGYSSFYIYPQPWDSPFPSAVQLFGIAQFSSGNQYDFTSSSTWSSSNTGVVNVTNGSSAGQVHPTSTGSAVIHSITNNDVAVPSVACGAPPDCSDSYSPLASDSPGTVEDQTPTLTGIWPGNWPSGKNTQVTFTGAYFGTNAPTINFSPGSGISYTLQSYNDTQIVAVVSVASGTPTEDVAVTITNNGYGGNSFYGGQQGNSSSSSSVYATVTNAGAGPVVTVIGWVNANASDITTSVNNGPSTAALKNNLTGGYVLCSFQLFRWSIGLATNLATAQDATYANAWLLNHSGNSAPPTSISVGAQFSAGDYRLFNSFGGSGSTYYGAGKTIFPCTTGGSFWDAAPQASGYMGATGSVNGKQYQLAEGRLGNKGQAINQTINGRTTPWIWSVDELDSSGNPTTSDHSMFPTFSIYVNGALQQTIPQSAASSFILNDATYQRTPSQIQ